MFKLEKSAEIMATELRNSNQTQEQMNEELVHAKSVVDKAEQKLNYFYSRIKQKEADLASLE